MSAQEQNEQLQYQQRLEPQFLTQQAMLQQHQQQQKFFYHLDLLAGAMPQMEPLPSGNLPPGFDASCCRSIYVGNIHNRVSEGLLAEVFASVGPFESCKLIRKEKSSYGFVDYFDHRSAAAALFSLDGTQMFGQSIKVNWAYASGHREDTTGHYNVFVGDLSPEITDATLFAAFCVYPTCSDARVMWDQRSGRSRGFGFVSFRSQQEAESAISVMTGKWLGNRPIRCSRGTKTNNSVQADENKNAGHGLGVINKVDQILVDQSPIGREVCLEERQEGSAGDGPKNNSQYTSVYVGNLAHQVTQAELHRQFHSLGAGVIENVRVQNDKGFGFVRYRTHEDAAWAIQAANGRVICGKSVKCSWGSKRTLSGSASTPLPLPTPVGPYQKVTTPGVNLGHGAADLSAYQHHITFAQPCAGGPLLPQSRQNLGVGHGQGSIPKGTGSHRLVLLAGSLRAVPVAPS